MNMWHDGRQFPKILNVCAWTQITQPGGGTGIAMYNCISVMLQDFTMFMASGFGFYDGTPKGSNTLL
jgi:hypothetical protein